MRPSSPSLPEKDFTLGALKQGLRIDGRGLLDTRAVELSFGPELGWVECALGKTRVLAHVESKMVKPPEERPFEGLITIHSEISPMASSDFELGRPSEEEVIITRMLDKILRRSDSVDKESLCIIAGQRVWHLRLTIHFLADAGNLLDCACLAGMVALKHFRRPEVEVIGDEVTVHPPSERAPVPLALHHSPYCFTFAYFGSAPGSLLGVLSSSSASESRENENRSADPYKPIVVMDPTRLEQTLAAGVLSLALNAQRELCVVQKAGGVPLDPDELLRAIDVGVQKVKELDAMVEAKLNEDWACRKVEVR